MDFLDPKARRNRSIRLLIGYALMAVLIFTASLILVYRTYGFDVDRKTGEVIQYGLVYTDSAPDKATIYVNGEPQKNLTNTRLSLQEGKYTMEIKKDGYRDWNKQLEVKGGEVIRLVYPMLIPTNLEELEISALGNNKEILRTQSPDRRYMLLQINGTISNFTEYDLRTLQGTDKLPVSRAISFPSGLFTNGKNTDKLEVVEWSNDNNHVLIKHTFDMTGSTATDYEFIMFDRKTPAESFNINKLLGQSPSKVSLRDKKYDIWYIQERETGNLLLANTNKELTPVANAVTTYKTHDDKTIIYAQKDTNDKTKQNIYIHNIGSDQKPYLLRQVNDGKLLLDVAKYDGDWYYAISTSGDKNTYIYKNPMSVLSKDENTKPAPISILHAEQADQTEVSIVDLAFSSNTRFIFARDGQNLRIYDAKDDKKYEFKFDQPIDETTGVKWMDGHRLMTISGGQIYYIDFDGANQQKLVGALPGRSVFFDRDYTVLYAINNSQKTADSVSLVRTSLRYEQDK